MESFILRLSELTVQFQSIIHQYFSPGFWLALLVIGPILIYRFGKVKKPVNPDKAFPVALIFGILMYLILYFLRPESADNLTKDIMSGILICCYSIINYFIMVGGESREPAAAEKSSAAVKSKSSAKTTTQKKETREDSTAVSTSKKTTAKETKCKRCGTKLPAGSQFCNKCGKKA